MTPETTDAGERNLGWRVVFAGLGINLALGILYTWSVFSKEMPQEWSEFHRSLPYSLACIIFSLVMVPAGRMQDRVSPRLTATIGGVLVGLGMILAGLTEVSLGWYVLGFGVLAGAGIGFGYASATPPAVKWFPPAKTGMIAGIVVSGFGLASVYAAPLARRLIATHGLQATMVILGIAFLVVVVVLAQFLTAPHAAVRFANGAGATGSLKEEPPAPATDANEFAPGEMLRTKQFYILWFMYACGAGAGLMVISKLAAITENQAMLARRGALMVAIMAVGNGAGRIVAGMASDRIGRKKTLLICFISQAVLVFLLSQATAGRLLASLPVMVVLSALIGANYGANLSLFPSIAKGYYGLRHFGTNYGLMFTAWGVGGFMLALVAGELHRRFHTFNYAYYGAAGLLVLAAGARFLVRPPRKEAAA